MILVQNPQRFASTSSKHGCDRRCCWRRHCWRSRFGCCCFHTDGRIAGEILGAAGAATGIAGTLEAPCVPIHRLAVRRTKPIRSADHRKTPPTYRQTHLGLEETKCGRGSLRLPSFGNLGCPSWNADCGFVDWTKLGLIPFHGSEEHPVGGHGGGDLGVVELVVAEDTLH